MYCNLFLNKCVYGSYSRFSHVLSQHIWNDERLNAILSYAQNEFASDNVQRSCRFDLLPLWIMILIVLLVFLCCESYSCSVTNRTDDRLVFAHIVRKFFDGKFLVNNFQWKIFNGKNSFFFMINFMNIIEFQS